MNENGADIRMMGDQSVYAGGKSRGLGGQILRLRSENLDLGDENPDEICKNGMVEKV